MYDRGKLLASIGGTLIVVYIALMACAGIWYASKMGGVYVTKEYKKLENPNTFNKEFVLDEASDVKEFDTLLLSAIRFHEDNGMQPYIITLKCEDSLSQQELNTKIEEAAISYIDDDYALILGIAYSDKTVMYSTLSGDKVSEILDSEALSKIHDIVTTYYGLKYQYSEPIAVVLDTINERLYSYVDKQPYKDKVKGFAWKSLIALCILFIISIFITRRTKKQSDLEILNTPINNLVDKYLDEKDN